MLQHIEVQEWSIYDRLKTLKDKFIIDIGYFVRTSLMDRGIREHQSMKSS